MKNLIFIAIAACVSIISNAQDIITTKSGIRIECKILKQDSTKVYFKFDKDGEEIETFLNKDQIADYEYEKSKPENIDVKFDKKSKFAVTIGVLQGGGSLIGADLEFLPSKYAGIQIGAGISSFGASLNMHFKPYIRSSFISLQYWNQFNYASYVGPVICYRGKKWLTAQFGFGYVIYKGPLLPADFRDMNVALMYSIGGYFTF